MPSFIIAGCVQQILGKRARLEKNKKNPRILVPSFHEQLFLCQNQNYSLIPFGDFVDQRNVQQCNQRISVSKSSAGSIVVSAFNPFQVDQLNDRNSKGLGD